MFAFALRIVASLSAPIDRGFVNPGFWWFVQNRRDERQARDKFSRQFRKLIENRILEEYAFCKMGMNSHSIHSVKCCETKWRVVRKAGGKRGSGRDRYPPIRPNCGGRKATERSVIMILQRKGNETLSQKQLRYNRIGLVAVLSREPLGSINYPNYLTSAASSGVKA